MVLTQKEGTVEGKLCREETVNSVEGGHIHVLLNNRTQPEKCIIRHFFSLYGHHRMYTHKLG